MTSGTRGAARERLGAAAAIAAEREALGQGRALAGATPVQPLALLNAIGETLPKDAVVIEALLAPGIRQLIRSDDPQSYFGLRGGGIGWGCRRRSASSSPCRIGRSSASATAAPCIPARRCGPPRATASTPCS